MIINWEANTYSNSRLELLSDDWGMQETLSNIKMASFSVWFKNRKYTFQLYIVHNSNHGVGKFPQWEVVYCHGSLAGRSLIACISIWMPHNDKELQQTVLNKQSAQPSGGSNLIRSSRRRAVTYLWGMFRPPSTAPLRAPKMRAPVVVRARPTSRKQRKALGLEAESSTQKCSPLTSVVPSYLSARLNLANSCTKNMRERERADRRVGCQNMVHIVSL